MQTPPLPGSVARSVSGRDEGTLYIVTEQYDGIYVAVSDGKCRGVSRPKRKNVRRHPAKKVGLVYYTDYKTIAVKPNAHDESKS